LHSLPGPLRQLRRATDLLPRQGARRDLRGFSLRPGDRLRGHGVRGPPHRSSRHDGEPHRGERSLRMMRGRLTALLCYFATLAVIVAVGAGWVAVNVQSEAGFTDLASQIGDDPQVQDVSAELAGEAFADQAGLPSVTRDAVARTVTRSIERLTRNDAW